MSNYLHLGTVAAIALAVTTNQSEKAAPAVQKAAGCEALTGTSLPNGKVDAAVPVAKGATVETEKGKPGLPAAAGFCRVQATLSAGPGSSIKVELWLPDRAAWNGKLLGAGNGGFGANLTIPALLMRGGVEKGYAAVGSDMGHFGESDVDAKWALNAPEKIKDFGWRANHLAAGFAKTIVAAYYTPPLKAAYFHGCSDGGREALMEAQRFPEDYDAVVAGAPAIPWTRMTSAFAADHLAVFGDPASALPADKLKLLQTASLGQCDKIDGVTDGVIDDPRRCGFDPGVLQCKPGDASGQCLSTAQVKSARALYRGARGPDGKPFFHGYAPGAEAVSGTWDLWLTGANAQHGRFATEFYRYMVHSDPNWQISSFDIARDYPLAKQRMGGDLDADNADLGPFLRRGGKLILYHGWNDAAIAPGNTIDYYQRVRSAQPGLAAGSVRLFMVPGMSHCLAGPGPNVFDAVGTLDKWRQGGPAPEQMVATKYDNDLFAYLGFPATRIRSRPLCAWPKVARWNGTGSTDDAASFSCAAPEK
jgi:feruloyl esterase